MSGMLASSDMEIHRENWREVGEKTSQPLLAEVAWVRTLACA